MTKPVGEACHEDGTLKDVSEIEWADSPTAFQVEAPQNDDELYELFDKVLYGSEDEGDNLPMAEVSLIL